MKFSFCLKTTLSAPSKICSIYIIQITNFIININYRVKVENILPADTVVVYKHDFGDISFLTLDALRPLPSEFRQIPQLAIPAKLHGITNFFDKFFPTFL